VSQNLVELIRRHHAVRAPIALEALQDASLMQPIAFPKLSVHVVPSS
jgi:hypothetical protein